MGMRLLLAVNRWFPKPEHPFNTEQSGGKRYVDWQFEQGHRSIEFYTARYTPDEMFRGKAVLDIGCGAGGKTMYYARFAPSKLYGADIVPYYQQEAEGFAAEKGADFTFLYEDAAHLSLPDDSLDTIIMNDAMEHVAEPAAVLREVHRVLKPGGRLFVNFPPYNHPFGAHLSDAIGIPWVHCLFRDRTLIAAYKKLVGPLPDGEKRIDFRIACDGQGREYFSYINRMTIKRFRALRDECGMQAAYYHEVPLRTFLSPLARIPKVKEYFVRMVVCVFEKKA